MFLFRAKTRLKEKVIALLVSPGLRPCLTSARKKWKKKKFQEGMLSDGIHLWYVRMNFSWNVF